MRTKAFQVIIAAGVLLGLTLGTHLSAVVLIPDSEPTGT